MTTLMTTSALLDQTRCCREAQRVWAQVSLPERIRPLRILRSLLVQEQEALCTAVQADMGKLPDETLAADVLPLADACLFLQREAKRLLAPRHIAGRLRPLWLMGQRDTVHRRPRGLIGLIGTWNYPLFLNGVALVQALTAGNGVLYKPSEVAPASASLLVDLLRRAGYPTDLVQLLPATRAMGKELAESDVNFISFTGASPTGRALASTLAERLIPSTLELSGCDAQFVLADADVGLAARAAWFGATVNRGQTCLAVRRAFVHRSLYLPFMDALRPLLEAATPMRLALRSQVEQARRLVSQALSEGGRLLLDRDEPDDGVTCLPRVVVDARPEMALCQEAAFAPILAVLPFDTLEEAWAADAQCPYALGASVFTRTPLQAEAWAGRLRTGTVTINDVIVSTAHPATPFGGTGMSGWGVTQGAEGLLDLTVPQVVSVRSGAYRPHYDLTAGGPPQGALVRGLLTAGHAPTFRARARGMMQLVRAMIRGN